MPEKYNMALRGSCQTHLPPFLPHQPVYSCLLSLPALEIWFRKWLRSKPHLWDHFCSQLSKTEKIKPCPCFQPSAKLEKLPHFKPQASSVPRLLDHSGSLESSSPPSWHHVFQDQGHNKTPDVKHTYTVAPYTQDFETGSDE